MTTWWKKLVLAVLLAVLARGCSHVDPSRGYTSRPLHPENIETVYVKMFENQTFRREVEFTLTSALCKQIELQTPYKLAADQARADTLLNGQITRISESVLEQQRELDRPIENEITLRVDVSWKDLRSGAMIIENQRFQFSGDYAALLAGGRPSAYRQAANELARRIVEAMEMPW